VAAVTILSVLLCSSRGSTLDALVFPAAAQRRQLLASAPPPRTLRWPLASSDWVLFVVGAVSMFLVSCVKIEGPRLALRPGTCVPAAHPINHRTTPSPTTRAQTNPQASGAGVGGGLLLMPALTAIAGFDVTTAVALSNLAIAAASVANVVMNFLVKQHPLRQGPVVDWDLTLLLSPATILGSTAGELSHVEASLLMRGLCLRYTQRFVCHQHLSLTHVPSTSSPRLAHRPLSKQAPSSTSSYPPTSPPSSWLYS